ncbi:MAG: ATP-binding cassette domain-containing protein [Bacilli bacterium]|nr:ATP-binding cassette domain-containing protein [Bacilli bacterium]MBO4682861.1 ATP-binding cassette domain-containing protein [Bacilli bacterium]
MDTKKKLLTISHLKKYFPIPKDSIFQKEQYFVRANEDISFDIYEGETIGLVGESGCGKSTLGRVILQLYDQTGGSTIYYGKDKSEVAPCYEKETIEKFDKYHAKYLKAKAKADNLRKQVADVGAENADFFLLQSKSLAITDEKTQFNKIVRIVGGFFAVEDKAKRDEGFRLMLKAYDLDVAVAKGKAALNDLEINLEFQNSQAKKKDKVIQKLNEQINAVSEQLEKDTQDNAKAKAELDEYKKQFLNDPKFVEYEAYVDRGVDLSRLKYREIRRLRRDLQIIFQDPYSSLNPRMTIGQILEEGLLTHHFYKRGSKAMKDYVLETMNKCGLQDFMVYRYPHQFSGGQRQRVCIARSLAVKPKFVVCDECVSALDVSIQSQIINLLDELKEQENLTYLFISHDLSVVKYISDRIGVMYLGSMVEFADKNTMFDDPRHPYTVSLLSSIPTTEVSDNKKERIILEGNIPSPIRPPHGCKFHTRCFMACEKCKRVPPELVEVEPGHFVACHFPERKLDKDGNYLFEVNKKKDEQGN